MFWCRAKLKNQPYSTYIWDQRFPTNVTPVPVPAPSGGVDGDVILKCSSGMLLANGDLLTTGGSNQNATTQSQPNVGHRAIYRYTTRSSNPAWIEETKSLPPLFIPEPDELNYTRWYGTSITLPDDEILAVGNADEITATQTQADVSTIRYDFRTFNPAGAGSWSWVHPPGTTLLNLVLDGTTCLSSSANDLLVLFEYPRLRYLAHSDEAMFVEGFDPMLYPTEPRSGSFTAYMKISGANPCASSTEFHPQRRWEIGRPTQPTPTFAQPVKNFFSQVAHLVTYDTSQQPPGKDTIYRISGGVRPGETVVTYPEAWKITNPSASNPNWTFVNNVIHKRVLANVLFLADGTIGMFGGVDNAVQTPTIELFKPIELFPNEPQVFVAAADLQIDRRIHQVPVLLPDGSVWIAGGQGPEPYVASSPNPSWRSYEIYKPPYMFKPRPTIEDPGGPWILQNGSLTNPIEVTLVPAVPGIDLQGNPIAGEIAPIVRAALIRPSVTTHQDDQHQRYIELETDFSQPPIGLTQTVNINLPPTQHVAPPGFYMLVVTDANGQPSPGRFVQVTP